MEHSGEYIGFFITFLTAAVIAGLMVFLNSILGPKGKGSAVKSEPFECGVDQAQVASHRGNFGVKFYLIAMLFILFDVEIIWLFPWAVILRELKWAGIFQMFSFLAVLAVGFVYAWKKGALEWEK